MGGFNFLYCGSILIGSAASIIVIRLAYVLYWSGRPLRTLQQRVTTLIILGSGGHTAEMLSIVNVLQKDRFVPRFYVAAATDSMSLQKARVLEESLIQKGEIGHENIEEVAYFEQIYRSREVGQSYWTSICTTLVAMMHALWLMLRFRPDVIFCNGPGTCIPLCLVAFIFKVAGLRWSSIFYIESIARVRRLSLSGFLLYKLHLADQFYVQWPQLLRKYPRAHYVGCLMPRDNITKQENGGIYLLNSQEKDLSERHCGTCLIPGCLNVHIPEVASIQLWEYLMYN